MLLTASLLLVIATICEAPLLASPRTSGGLFWLFTITFILSTVGFLIAALILSIGRQAMVAGSAAAAATLAGFGILWLLGQAVYLFGQYFTPSSGLLLVSTILMLLALISGLIAAIIIGVRRFASGAARWSLLIGLLVSGITGASSSPALITVMHLISAVAVALVGLSYLIDRVHGSSPAGDPI